MSLTSLQDEFNVDHLDIDNIIFFGDDDDNKNNNSGNNTPPVAPLWAAAP
ncbi:MAG: hypothetical protein U1E31_02990 [Rickettsiales bacterium]